MYSLADVSICIPYWMRAEGEVRRFRNNLYTLPDVEISLCCDGGTPLETHLTPYRHCHLPYKDVALNPCTPINAAVRNSTKPVIVLCNPETCITDEMLERMLAELDADTYVAAACMDADTGRWLCHSTVKGGEHGRGPMPEGSGFHFLAMLTRSLWDRAGGFDEDYRDGQGYDDNDFLWRLKRAGAKFKVLDDVVVSHKRSTTAWPTGGLERNRALFRAKWG